MMGPTDRKPAPPRPLHIPAWFLSIQFIGEGTLFNVSQMTYSSAGITFPLSQPIVPRAHSPRRDQEPLYCDCTVVRWQRKRPLRIGIIRRPLIAPLALPLQIFSVSIHREYSDYVTVSEIAPRPRMDWTNSTRLRGLELDRWLHGQVSIGA